MLWVTWRQHRVALLGVVFLLGAVAAMTWFSGIQMHKAFAEAMACRPVSSPACGEMFLTANRTNAVLAGGYALLAVPALIGAFTGATVLARELETGTYRFTWTQGFGRTRWALAKLVTLSAALAVAAAGMSLVFDWYYVPFFAPRDPAMAFSAAAPLAPGLFPLRGVAFPAWTIAAFAIGAFAGVLLRRVVPAIAASLALNAGLTVLVGAVLRQHYIPAVLTSSLDVPASGWITSQWWTSGGQYAFDAHGHATIARFQQLCPTGDLSLDPVQCFVQHGYTQWTLYQPADRFWPFQLIEAGWLLVLSALLIAATVRLVRRRAA
jgi:hypothetical protein